MVTGAYYPEISGASLQCRALIRALGARAACTVLTTTMDSSLPSRESVDGVTVHRITVHPGSVLLAAARMAWRLLRLSRRIDVVHLHGFSRKSRLVLVLAKLLGKPVIIKLTSVGHDDPVSIRGRGRFDAWCYARAEALVGVSPQFGALARSAGLDRRFHLIPNGVDLGRFHPVSVDERKARQRELGLSPDRTWMLCVGFFSAEKCPDVLFDAWTRMQQDGWPMIGLIFVGATRGPYYEIDPALSARIRAEAARLGIERHVAFVEQTHDIERYYQAADCFVLPSVREGLPNVLLEAMASGLPCVATRLPGVTDALLRHDDTGLLVPPRDPRALEQALRSLLEAPDRAAGMGRRARDTVAQRYGLPQAAEAHLALYHRVGRRAW